MSSSIWTLSLLQHLLQSSLYLLIKTDLVFFKTTHNIKIILHNCVTLISTTIIDWFQKWRLMGSMKRYYNLILRRIWEFVESQNTTLYDWNLSWNKKKIVEIYWVFLKVSLCYMKQNYTIWKNIHTYVGEYYFKMLFY